MKPYRLHFFVCQGKRCAAQGSEELLDLLKKGIKGAGLNDVKVSKSGCLKMCKQTPVEGEYSPAIVVYPQGVWYRNVAAADIDEIISSHAVRGEPVERLVYYRLPA